MDARRSEGGEEGGGRKEREGGGGKEKKEKKSYLIRDTDIYPRWMELIGGKLQTHSSWDTFASRRSIKTCTRGKKRRRIKVEIRTNRLSTNDVTLDAATITRMSVMLTRHLVP